ncbi:1,4-alpha-glucan branching protein GlgB [Bacillus timonensis]|uniref:1,4-alpha-glucan branching enzyme GlgB n=1 Tax=Bacillus timonensis TaxID=1033734 RepID=A0A4V3V753_9BACI|nr:1,4-alpha-glucan branching protein GlgB [Bacillus timonensis]THE10043.1 1,4-alpha-glucan branching protein GlgB [Bacillus timonensis]
MNSTLDNEAELFPSEFDLYLFHEGTLIEGYNMLGAHVMSHKGIDGVRFSVWAPHARAVAVVGDFNNWNGNANPLERIPNSGVWVGFIPRLKEGDLYKYEITTANGEKFLKADPYAFYSEVRPNTASIITRLDQYKWNDKKWLNNRDKADSYNNPMLIYELHTGSWKKKEDDSFYTYRELADEVIDYVVEHGFTHIELMPIMEHPFDLSWGYQITGFFSVTSRHGNPLDFMYFVDQCHQKGIGVILDWVPVHFCRDSHGLGRFDGTPLYEHTETKRADRPLWGTYSFDFTKPEIHSFLLSNLAFWMDVYHIDGFRIDAVSSLIYLNHDNPQQEKLFNQFGGEENLEAIEFIKKANEAIFKRYPGVLMIAEEATDYPLVTAPTSEGGLGFNYKWNMGWVNDVLKYMQLHPSDRRYHHNLLTFSFFYAFSENFILPFSHDDVVHGKKSLLDKMPGDYWQKFANLRLLYGYLMTHPGKKLLFMGGEFGQFSEWKELEELDWMLLDYDSHAKLQAYYKELQHFYHMNMSLWRLDHEQEGFEWIDPDNHGQSVITFIRHGKRKGDYSIIVCNFSSEVYENYRIGVPSTGSYIEMFNSDSVDFGGSGQINAAAITVEKTSAHNQPYSMTIKVPPLAISIFRKETKKRKRGVVKK